MQKREIARLLPAILQRTLPPDPDDCSSPLAALLSVMEKLHQPTEDVLGKLETYFDPYDAPEVFVFCLAGWLNLARLFDGLGTDSADHFPTGVGRLRELIVSAVSLANNRGTSTGLRQFLEIATGIQGFTIREDSSKPFHIIVSYPPEAARYQSLIKRIIELEKPAYVTYDLTMAPYTDTIEASGPPAQPNRQVKRDRHG